MSRDVIYNPYNLLLLATATSLSAILLTPMPLLVGIICELLWIAYAVSMIRRGYGGEPNNPSLGLAAAEVSAHDTDRDVDVLTSMIERRAAAHPYDEAWQALMMNSRALAHRLISLRKWRDVLLCELQGTVEVAKQRYDERDARGFAGTGITDPAEAIEAARALRFGSTIDGFVDLELIDAERGSIPWIRAYCATGRACIHRELNEISRRRDCSLYESEKVELSREIVTLLVAVKRLDSVARLTVNLDYELEMLRKAGSRLANELLTRPAIQLNADLNAVLLHADSLARSAGRLAAVPTEACEE